MKLQNEHNTETDFFAAARQKAQRIRPLLENLFSQHSKLDYGVIKHIMNEAKNLPLVDRQHLEAVLRMTMLGMNYQVIEHFVDTGRPSMFISPCDYTIPIDSVAIKEIEQFENEYGGVVYAVIRSNTVFARLDALLYVCKTTGEWSSDRRDIKDRIPLAYVVNQDTPMFSEFGSIGLMVSGQGFLTRTA